MDDLGNKDCDNMKHAIIECFTGKHERIKTISPVSEENIIFSRKNGDEVAVADRVFTIACSMNAVKLEITGEEFH